MSDEEEFNFVIVQFTKDSSVEVIRLDWVKFDEDGNIIGAYFPSTTNKRYFRDILQNNPIPDYSWTNNGELWKIKRTFHYYGNYFSRYYA